MVSSAVRFRVPLCKWDWIELSLWWIKPPIIKQKKWYGEERQHQGVMKPSSVNGGNLVTMAIVVAAGSVSQREREQRQLFCHNGSVDFEHAVTCLSIEIDTKIGKSFVPRFGVYSSYCFVAPYASTCLEHSRNLGVVM